MTGFIKKQPKTGLAGAWVFIGLLFCFLNARADEYFDPHNHLNGIMPFQAYANLPQFLEKGVSGITESDLRGLYKSIRAWDPEKMKSLGLEVYTPHQRFGLGARMVLDQVKDTGTDGEIKGALERILTATPWTEFDSAYAFRGDPVNDYLAAKFYSGDKGKESKAILQGIEIELSREHISESEQSMSFVGGWNMKNGKSGRLDTVNYFISAKNDPVLRDQLQGDAPTVKILLMTHAGELGTADENKDFTCYSPKGWGKEPLDNLLTGPDVICSALLGEDFKQGNSVPVVKGDRTGFFNTVVGIDTAGAELEEMTGQGMDLYKKYVMAVYWASKMRREKGWNGKLLVHTHVGEGSCIYRPKAGSFKDEFGAFPAVFSSQEKMESNISEILGAIGDLEKERPDLLNYVVFRLGHVTWADEDEAKKMADLRVEADVNLESNVATGAYPLNRMSLTPAGMKKILSPYLGSETKTWELNDLLGVLIPKGEEKNIEKVGKILRGSSLKYLLENHVPVLLGTDGAGVEHSNIEREYALAESLIQYWKKTDPGFQEAAGDLDPGYLFNSVKWHLKNMAEKKEVAFIP